MFCWWICNESHETNKRCECLLWFCSLYKRHISTSMYYITWVSLLADLQLGLTSRDAGTWSAGRNWGDNICSPCFLLAGPHLGRGYILQKTMTPTGWSFCHGYSSYQFQITVYSLCYYCSLLLVKKMKTIESLMCLKALRGEIQTGG